MSNSSDDRNTLEKISTNYENLYFLRALFQAIPFAGGGLDTLILESGRRYNVQRIESLLKLLSEEVKKIKVKINSDLIEDNEEIYDMMILAIQESSKTRSEIKRKNFAKIIANQLHDPIDWNLSESILRIITQLSEQHVEILKLAKIHKVVITKDKHNLQNENSHNTSMSLDENGQLAFRNNNNNKDESTSDSIDLREKFPKVESVILEQSCVELSGLGLLRDWSAGTLGWIPNMSFALTDFGSKFLETIEP